MSAPSFTYVPAPHERGYYGALFQAADTERSGSIGGGKAVEFFTRSKIPVSTLKHIWAASDQPPSNTLDARKFAVAVRLIQMEQNGIKPSGPDLGAVPGTLRPVWFEGIQLPDGSSSPQKPQPPTPPRPPAYSVGGGASVAGSVARSVATTGRMHHSQQLTVQDPYSLMPTEQARYESIFPEYCKQDPNYMYGGEAVALFNKSGLSQQQLAQIWNMVDVPVDNRLDKLEFAIAMHLIVCVSKKNLQLPQGLPISLKQLKSQQVSDSGGAPPIPSNVAASTASVVSGMPPPPHQGGAPSSITVPPPLGVEGGSVGLQSQSRAGGIPTPQAYTSASDSVSMSMGASGIPSPHAQPPGSSISGLQGPPPIQPRGGLNVSDAFAGLDAGDTGSISSYGATPANPGMQTTGYEQQQQSPPSPQLASANIASVPDSSRMLSQQGPVSGSTGIGSGSGAAAGAPPPKTSAQLASSYNMGEANEELEKLRGALQKLQAENISLKAKMGSMSEEENDVQRELSATVAEVSTLSHELTALRAQMLASKSRLLEAAAELKAVKEKKGVIKDLIAEAGATKKAIDEATEGIETANEAARAAPAPEVLPAQNADLFGWGNDASTEIAPAPAPLPSQPVASMASSSQYSEEDVTPVFNNSYMQASAPAPPPTQIPDQNSYMQASAPAPAPAPAQTQMLDQNSYVQASAPAPPPAPTQIPAANMYNGGGYKGHNRDLSTASGFGEVMGGGPILQSLVESSDLSAAASSYDAISNSVSMKEVEILKSKSKEADDIARDASESRRQLVAQMEELRRLADEAQNKVRTVTSKPNKKGVLGRAKGKKKDAKEAERLAMDARNKKEALLQAQAQVKDAEALAEATKKESEFLRGKAEDAELQVASVASMKPQSAAPAQATNGFAPPGAQNAYGMPQSNPSSGHNAPNAYGVAPHSYGMPPPQSNNGGFAPPSGEAYGPSAMGGGSMGIPTSSGADDPYSNPFG